MSNLAKGSLVLITGGTGFVGAHVLQQVLEAGYRVRATARPQKVDALKEKYAGKAVEVVGIADIAAGDYTEALQGVNAVIHVAAPLPGRADPAGMIDGAVGGALNIIRQAADKGVRRVVLTSTMLTLLDLDRLNEVVYSDHVISVKDWNPATKEAAISGEHDSVWIYAAAKTVAEQEVWKFADAHPEVDITTINPPFIYGPLVEGSRPPKDDAAALSTAGILFHNVFPPGGNTVELTTPQTPVPVSVDVRDVARAHVLALRAPLTSDVGRKRLVICGPKLTWKNAVEHLKKVRPELRSRLPNTSKAEELKTATTEDSLAIRVLGFGDYISWEKTVEDAAESLLSIEKEWAKAA